MESKFIRLTAISGESIFYLNIDLIQRISLHHPNITQPTYGSCIWINGVDSVIYSAERPNRIIDLINGKIDISILEEGDEITCWEPGGMWSKTFEVVQNPHGYGLCWKFDIGGDIQYSDDLDEKDMDLKYWHRK